MGIKTLIITAGLAICAAESGGVAAQAQTVLVQYPPLQPAGFPRPPLCRFTDGDLPPWYQIENGAMSVKALPPVEVEGYQDTAGDLSFQVTFKKDAANKTVTFNRSFFGPVTAMLLTENRFVAAGCSGSHKDYVYVANALTPDRGIGIACKWPQISPTGQYVFFSSGLARSGPPTPAYCCFVLNLHEEKPAAYRVYPPCDGTGERVDFEAMLPDEQWYWPQNKDIFECHDSNGRAHQPDYPAVWSADGQKIAFVVCVVAERYKDDGQEPHLADAWEYSEAREFVVLDFSNGPAFPKVLSLPMDYSRILEPERIARPYATPIAHIQWLNDKAMEVTFWSGEPGLLLNTKFRFEIPAGKADTAANAGFFDYAKVVDGQSDKE